MERLQRIGTRMRLITKLLIAATPVAFFAAITLAGLVALLPVPHEVSVDLTDLSIGGLATIAGLAALKPAVFLVGLWLLQDLFARYGRGFVFEACSIRRVRQLGWVLIAVDAADLLQRLAVGPLLTELGAAEPFLTVGIGFSMSIVGVFVIIVARIMDLGRELKEFEALAI